MQASTFDKDFTSNKIFVTCTFSAPLSKVWDAFSNPATLEKWFAPKPYKAVTKTADFREGGQWLYYMLSPEGEKTWAITRHKEIFVNQSYEASDAFCDENGMVNTDLPQMNWRHEFMEKDNSTTVYVTITLTNEKDMKQILEMGFEEGYKTALNQLQEILGM